MIRRTLLVAVLTLVSPMLWAQSPADGAWDFTMVNQMGSVNAKVMMKGEDATLTGEFDLGGGRTWEIEDGKIEGNIISFNINRDGASFTYVMSAQVDGDAIKGTATAMGSTVDWSMTRGD